MAIPLVPLFSRSHRLSSPKAPIIPKNAHVATGHYSRNGYIAAQTPGSMRIYLDTPTATTAAPKIPLTTQRLEQFAFSEMMGTSTPGRLIIYPRPFVIRGDLSS